MKRRSILRFSGFFLLCSLIGGLPVCAQSNNFSIAGTVVDQTSQQPIEFATVQLLDPKDSTVVKTTVTERKGKFLLEDIAAGQYVVAATFIGYSKIVKPVIVDQHRENIGTLEIGILGKNMAEVVVTGRRSLLNTSIDRKIYNVAQDLMAQSGSASDILKNIPSVEVDIEGAVLLRGSGEVMILINGRPSPLMGRPRAEVLQQLPANSIERIEVITNPSARYRPDGVSGIINIVLKKNLKTGWNGTIIANAGNHDRYNGTINLNYKPGRFNIFGNYSIRQNRRLRINSVNRQVLDSMGATESYYSQSSGSFSRPLSHMITLGMDYIINDRNSIGISANSHYREMTLKDLSVRSFFDKNNLLTSRYNRTLLDPEWEKEKDATVYWQHNFPREDHELRVEFNISSTKEHDNNRYSNIFLFPPLPPSFDNTFVRDGEDQQQLTIDYTNALSENSKIEAGYDGSFNEVDLDFYGEFFDTTQQRFVKDELRSNRFRYNDAIHAIYGTYEHAWEKFGFSAGLRAEQSFLKGDLVTKDSLFRNRYFKIYPTIHFSLQINKSEIQLNYSKRVNRPDGDELNPFTEYQDPLNLRAGNPALLPEIIHSVELGYKWQNNKFSFVPSLYYRYKLNGFTSVTLPLNDSVLLTTEQNLAKDNSAGLELIFSAKAGTFLTANLSTNLFYNTIDASNLGYITNKSIVSMSTNFNATTTLTKTTLMQFSCNYRSARLTPQGKGYASFVFNTGIRQDFFKKKVSLTLTASDIFNSLRQKNELNTPFLKQVSVGKRDARNIYLGVSYRFGLTLKKNDEENLQFDDSL